MWVRILLGINIFIGLMTIVGVGLSIYKTHILTHNHLHHLAKDVKNIDIKLEEIDNTQKMYGIDLAKIQSTCAENGKQITILQTKEK